MGIDPIRADSKLKIIIEFFVLHLYADGTMTENRRFDTSASKNVLYTHVFLDLFKRKIIHICKHAILEYRQITEKIVLVYSSSLFIDLTTTSMNTRTPTFRAYSAYSFSTVRSFEQSRAEANENADFMQPCAICARLREKEIIVFPQYRIRSYYQMVRCNGDLAQRQSIRMCPCSYHINPSFPP